MTKNNEQIIINNFFREIYDIDGNVIDYEIKYCKIPELIKEIKRQNLIKEKMSELLTTFKAIKENSNVFTSEFTLVSGAITALNEVLKILNGEIK